MSFSFISYRLDALVSAKPMKTRNCLKIARNMRKTRISSCGCRTARTTATVDFVGDHMIWIDCVFSVVRRIVVLEEGREKEELSGDNRVESDFGSCLDWPALRRLCRHFASQTRLDCGNE